MRDRMRAGLAVGIATLCLAAGIAGSVQAPLQFTGITLRMEENGLVIDTVAPASAAAGRLEPGMRVIEINGSPADAIDRLDPDLDLYMSGEFVTLTAEDLTGSPVDFVFPVEAEPIDRAPFLLGVGLLVGVAIWVGRGLAGDGLRRLAVPLATASAAPLLVSPLLSSGDALAVAATIVLPTSAAVVLADGFIARIRVVLARRTALTVILFALLALPAWALLISSGEQRAASIRDLTFLLNLGVAVAISAMLVTSGALLASTSRIDPAQSTTWRADRLPVLLAAATPGVAAAAAGYVPLGYGVSVPLLWLLVVVVVLQTNGRLEVLRLQRDTVVAATEAERARLAAELHDDALQQMSVLIRRLDQEGAAADAEMARTIADRLRDVCGELRLPILDELGAGPALEWLVERIASVSGGEVRLERADSSRPPADVELAFFRIAQEALSNAVNHGAPPITVEYSASPGQASLSITDRGAGIPPHAAASAPRSGHYGLLNMRQRADQIGARIDFARQPAGGTSVGLRWGAA